MEDAFICPEFVKDLINVYMEKWAKVRKSTWQEDDRVLRKDVQPLWGNLKISEVTKRNVLQLVNSIVERGSPIAANRTFAIIRRMFNFALEQDFINCSPCLSIKLPGKERRRDRVLSLSEVKFFWSQIKIANMHELIKLSLKLQLVCIQRKGEIITAEWTDFDLQERYWTIPSSKTKNRVIQRVYLSDLTLLLLDEIKLISNKSRYLLPSFVNPDKHIRATSIDRALKRNRLLFSSIASFTPHDLRRTGASHIASLGTQRIVLMKLLNHVDNSVTAIYDRYAYEKEKRKALVLWSNKLINIIS